MASTSANPQRRLSDFLKDQQEPFILEVYLSERGYSKRLSLAQHDDDSGKSTLERSASSASNKLTTTSRKILLPFPKVLTAVFKNLAFHSERKKTRNHENGNEDVDVPDPKPGRVIGQAAPETERFSSASSSTVFNSCSEIEEEEASISSHREPPSFSSETCQSWDACSAIEDSQQATKYRKHCRRCINERPASQDKLNSGRFSLSQNVADEEVRRVEHKIRSCSVLVPKKITEDSLLSAGLWGLLFQSAKKESSKMELKELLGPNVSQMLKSKRLLQKTKQLLFDCVREITLSFPRKDEEQKGCKQLLGPEELAKLICERAQEWGGQAGQGKNLTYLLTLDYLNSANEWSDFGPEMKDIGVGIADVILESIINEIVLETSGHVPPTV